MAVVILGIGVAIEAIARTWYMIFQANERLDLISLSIVLQRTLTALIGIVVLKLGGGVIASWSSTSSARWPGRGLGGVGATAGRAAAATSAAHVARLVKIAFRSASRSCCSCS